MSGTSGTAGTTTDEPSAAYEPDAPASSFRTTRPVAEVEQAPGRRRRPFRRIAADRRAAGHDVCLLERGEHDVRPRDERGEHRPSLLVGPQPAPQVEVETDRHAGRSGGLDRGIDRSAAALRQCRSDAGQVEMARPAEEAGLDRRRDVVPAEPRTGRTGPSVQDLRWADRPPLAEHDPRAALGLDPDAAGVDALATEAAEDRRPEAVVADPPDERDRMAEPDQADRDIRLGPGDVTVERGGLGQRPDLAARRGRRGTRRG